jgi:hypothetical protein
MFRLWRRFENVPAYRKQSSHRFLACLCEHFKNGNKVAALHPVLRALYLWSQPRIRGRYLR